ncbi:hypothetical protein [Saccharicrinis aurantiacus]|uniref:hypothetical protein n=1 Tax=Saccharicrinis aurantiacus TaxID=1849719 RepID=UPI002490BFD5|nr:hypothetical protein [Saccharicrinis aurantiacus]
MKLTLFKCSVWYDYSNVKKRQIIMRGKYSFIILLQLILCLYGCSDDDGFKMVDGNNPTLEMEDADIRTDVATGFVLKGLAKDNDGLSHITIKSSELNINKKIDLIHLYDNLLHEYELDYAVTSNDNMHAALSNVLVTVYDVLGNATEAEVKVDFTGDFESPQFIQVPPLINYIASGDNIISYSFELEVEDNKELAEVSVKVEKISYNEVFVDFPDDYRKFATQINLELPGESADYEVVIQARDYENNVSEHISIIKVSEIPNYEKLYVVEGDDESVFENNIFGVPMMVERVDDFVYETGYYVSTPNTEIRFLPQKDGFTPVWYGIDSKTDLIVAAKEMDDALPIVIAEAGYTKVRINILTGEYSLTKYTPTDAIPTDGFLNGSPGGQTDVPVELGLVCPATWFGHMAWELVSPQMLVQDDQNPYIYRTEFHVPDGTTNVKFIIAPKSTQAQPTWWHKPNYKWDDLDNPEAVLLNAGNNPGNWSVPVGGTYCFEFDAHLLRPKLYLKRD